VHHVERFVAHGASPWQSLSAEGCGQPIFLWPEGDRYRSERVLFNVDAMRKGRVKHWLFRALLGCIKTIVWPSSKSRFLMEGKFSVFNECYPHRAAPFRLGEIFPTRRVARSFAMRASVEGLCTAHSLILKTFHPSRLSSRTTRRSRFLLVSIFLRQNSGLVRGKYLQLQPCQKHPSTKTAIFLAGHAKSGLPTTRQCLRYPRSFADHSNLPKGNSVVVFPRERTAAIIFERIFFETWSTQPRPIASRIASGRRGQFGRTVPACNASLQRA
jgi:hypothetical protein